MDNCILFFPESTRFTELQLRHCGIEHCKAGHSYGPAVRDTYIIHIVLKGKGIFMFNQQTYHLGAGDGFLIEPGIQTFYRADDKDPWIYAWIAFQGSSCSGIIRELGLSKENLTFHSSRSKDLANVVLSILMHKDFTKYDYYMNYSHMLRFIAILAKDMEVKIGSQTGRNKIVSHAIRYIEENYMDPSIKVSDIAREVNVERGYLYTLFMKHLNLSPQDYLTKFRLTKATDLLNHTEYSVDKVSMSCGYQDSVTFSKAFKRMFRVPPSKYRTLSRFNMRYISKQATVEDILNLYSDPVIEAQGDKGNAENAENTKHAENTENTGNADNTGDAGNTGHKSSSDESHGG